MMRRTKSNTSLNKDSAPLSSRLEYTEKFLENIRSKFEKVAQKEATLRNYNDEIVEVIFEYTRKEEVNTTLKINLEEFAEQLIIVGDYRDALIKRMESQLIEPLEKYRDICKQKKDVATKTASKSKKNVEEKEKLDRKFNRSPSDHQGISTIQNTVQHAQTQSHHSKLILHEEFSRFEQMKLNDIKKCFTDLTLIHLAFHSRALQYYTNAHQKLLKINVEQDFQEFRHCLTAPHSTWNSSNPPLGNNSNQKKSNEISVPDEYANSLDAKKGNEKKKDDPIPVYAEVTPQTRTNPTVPPRPPPPPSSKSQSLVNLSESSSASSLQPPSSRPLRAFPNANKINLHSPSPSTTSSSSSSSSSDSDE